MKGGAVETNRSLGFTCNVKKLGFWPPNWKVVGREMVLSDLYFRFVAIDSMKVVVDI